MNNMKPMEFDGDSPLISTKTFTVGLIQASALVGRVFEHVKELVSSNPLQIDENFKLKVTQTAAEIQDFLNKDNDIDDNEEN